MDAFWIILTGFLVAASCGLLGCFLVLRRMAMVGDAISHAVLPGIVIAYLLFEDRSSLPMILGAAVVGVFTTMLIEWFSSRARVQTDASIGITFTWLFAIGIILISVFAGQVDLDQDCVLYGEILFVPLDTISIAGLSIPKDVAILGITLIVLSLIIRIGYRGFFITSFNPEYASAMGISVMLWHYVLMSMVSVTTVVSFESVGAILVVAFLVVLPATAYLLTEQLPRMIGITLLLGLLTAIGGYFFATAINGSIAGAMTVVAGLLFLLALLFSPYEGVLRKRKLQQVG